MAVPFLQVILQQTKHFTCICDRCQDPSEFGSNLAALKCPDCKIGAALPQKPTDMKTDLECNECGAVIDAERVISVRQTYYSCYHLSLLRKKGSPQTNYVQKLLKWWCYGLYMYDQMLELKHIVCWCILGQDDGGHSDEILGQGFWTDFELRRHIRGPWSYPAVSVPNALLGAGPQDEIHQASPGARWRWLKNWNMHDIG